jgi:hypothetical protein
VSDAGVRAPWLVQKRAEFPKMRDVGLLLKHRVGATARLRAACTGEPGAVLVVVPGVVCGMKGLGLRGCAVECLAVSVLGRWARNESWGFRIEGSGSSSHG